MKYIKHGNHAFKSGDYYKALELYSKAQVEMPELRNSIEYNITETKKIIHKNYETTKKINANKFRITWVINKHDKMTHSYRVFNYADELENEEITSKIIQESDFECIETIDADLVVLCRIAGNTKTLQSIQKCKNIGCTVIFDIDDLIFDPRQILNIKHVAHSSPKYRNEIYELSKKLENTLKNCDLVTTSTNALKIEAEKYGLPCFVIPNSISRNYIENSNRLTKTSKENKPLTIGYFSGTSTHDYDFLEIRDALIQIMNKFKNINLLIVGHLKNLDDFSCFGSRFTHMKLMNHSDLMKIISTIDINVAPLEMNNRFTQCKSELKVFEAALYEVPTIASMTTSLSSVILNGYNGYLACNKKDWEEALTNLITNTTLRNEIGSNAKRTIATRFYITQAKNEYHSLINKIKSKKITNDNVRSYPITNDNSAKISIVSILYKKREELIYFLESLRKQKFELAYEVLLVDDCCPDNSIKSVESFMKFRMPLSDTNKNMCIKVIRNDQNLGNCRARNIGVNNSSGDAIVIVDADCILNEYFLFSHHKAHLDGMCDIAIGPKGIETNHSHPDSVINSYNIDISSAIKNATPQDEVNQDSFINCVTRNFSINKKFLSRINSDLFDPNFTYSASAESGFGWEDVELGCRVYLNDGRIKYLSDTASIHISHKPTVENSDKPIRSLKNFKKLHEKHPWLKDVSHEWTLRTFNAIKSWCSKVGFDLINNNDYTYLDNHIRSLKYYKTYYPKKNNRLKILTYRWHCPHQYELYKLCHDFTLVTGIGTSLTEQWDLKSRPMPINCEFRNINDIKISDYDLAILHFDENVLNPDYSYNPTHGKKLVPPDWGNAFKTALNWDLPKIAICHGTPQFYGQYNKDYKEPNLGHEIFSSKIELTKLLENVMVVCNSNQAMKEWGFKKSTVIWHGFTPSDYLFNNAPNLRMLTMSEAALNNRPHYNGLFVINDLKKIFGKNYNIGTIINPDPVHTITPLTNQWAKAKFENYTRELAKYSMYINPTLRSPMPRTRGEAMMSGLVTISMRNHDVDQFIKNGVNGFYADTTEEMADQIKFLHKNPNILSKIGFESKATALNIFNQHQYLYSWNNIINELIK